MTTPCIAHYDFALEEVLDALARKMRDVDHSRGVTFKFSERGSAGPFHFRIRCSAKRLIIDVFEEAPSPDPMPTPKPGPKLSEPEGKRLAPARSGA